MGNVQHKGKADGLTKFQREKLKHEFYTFFDLNNDGCLTYKDFLWAKDKICYMSGWKIDSPKYKITEALFHEIWESLEIIADVDKDGKITKTEWLMMWKTYKKEIMEKEKKEADFLKKYYKYQTNKSEEAGKSPQDSAAATENQNGSLDEDEKDNGQANIYEEDDWPVQLDSDEEPLSIVERQAGMKKRAVAHDEVEAEERLSPEDKKTELLQEGMGKDIAEPTILEQFAADKSNFEEQENSKLPKWLHKYLVFRFNLLDRVGDGVIDHEEFEYVLSEFGVSERVARQAFTIVTQNNTADLDFEYFVRLFEEYYLSDNPSDLGNFINGRLEFETEENGGDSGEEEDPGLVDHQAYSSTSLHSMDDDLHPEMENGSHHNHHQKKVETVGGGEPSAFKRLCDTMKSCWVV